MKVGTIHSHCDFGASHSHGDHADEEHFDGIHITLGHVTSETPSLSVSLVIDGIRFHKLPQENMEGVRVDVTVEEEPVYETNYVQAESVFEEMSVPEESEPLIITNPVEAYLVKRYPRIAQTLWPEFKEPLPPPKKIFHVPVRSRYIPIKTQTGVRKNTVRTLVLELPEGRTVESYEFPEDWPSFVKPNTTLGYTQHSYAGYKKNKKAPKGKWNKFHGKYEVDTDEEESESKDPGGGQTQQESTDLDPTED